MSSRSTLVAGVLAAAIMYAIAAWDLIHSGGKTADLGWSLSRDAAGLFVDAIRPDGPATELRRGDRVITVQGVPPIPHLGLVAFMDLADGETYVVGIRRGDVPQDLSLQMQWRYDAAALWLRQVPLLLVSLTFFFTGLAVGYVRPHDRLARLYAAFACLVAIVLLPFGVFGGEFSRGPGRMLLALERTAAAPMLATGYYFFMAFPPGLPMGRFWRWTGRVLIAWTVLLLPGAAAVAWATARSANAGIGLLNEYDRWFAAYDLLSTIFVLASFTAAVAVIVRNQWVVVDVVQRRRLRWLMWGSLFGAAPMLAVFTWSVASEAATGRAIDLASWVRAQAAAALFLVSLPVTFSYAVVKHRVIGIDVAIRKSLQYLLARNVLRAAIMVPVLAIIIRVATNADQTVAQLLLERPLYLMLSLIGAGALATRRRLMSWLDRRFFREAANRDRILLDLVSRIAAAGDRAAQVAESVRDGLELALHPTFVDVCLRSPERGLVAMPANPHDTWLAVPSIDDQALQSFQETGQPSVVDHGDAALVVPIGGGARHLHGVLRLGPKKSDEPYTEDERRVLTSIADRIAIAADNETLRSQVAVGERHRHQVLARVDDSINIFKECPKCGRCFDRAHRLCDDDGAALDYSIGIERAVQGRYRIERLLGHGGMGVVYAATDLRLQRAVAVKLIKNAAVDAETRRRFELEARALAKLRHPHIVAIHDYGTVGDEVAFLVMELLRGSTLRDALRQDGAMAPPQVAAWAGQVFDAVAFAHSAGIIHRDLKPANLFFSSDSSRVSAKVLDFGLAKLSGSNAATSVALTAPGAVVGTLAYMSPEQLTGGAVDERTDMFALGVTLFEALTGVNPFGKGDAVTTLASLVNDHPRLVADDPIHGTRLDRLIQQLLAKAPSNRPADLKAVGEELVGALLAWPAGVRCHAASN